MHSQPIFSISIDPHLSYVICQDDHLDQSHARDLGQSRSEIQEPIPLKILQLRLSQLLVCQIKKLNVPNFSNRSERTVR